MHGATDGTAGVEMQCEIWTRITAIRPTIDLGLIGADCGGDGLFGGSEIGPRGSGGDVALAIQALAELIVGTAYVFVEGVAAASFVAGEVVAIAGARSTVGVTRLRISRG